MGVNSWENYAILVNGISLSSLLDISSIHRFPSRSIDFVLDFSQADIDVDVFLDIPLGM